MLKYLPTTIETYGSSSRKTVSHLIQNIKGDKTQIRYLVDNLRDFDFTANYTPAFALKYSVMNLENVVDFFRDSSLRMNQFFSASSSISNIINSLIYIFSSEIEKIEKDINYLENFIDNYQFISGDNDLFNFNYIENFDNNLNSHYLDDPSIPLVDRDNINFSENGNYHIDSIVGKMSISNGSSFVNILQNISSIKEVNNYSEYITTDSGFNSSINENIKDNWSVTAKSPVILTSHLKELSQYVSYDYSSINGAETAISIDLINPVDMDFIRIFPNESNGLQLLQVVLTKTDAEMSIDSTSPNAEYVEFSVLNSPLQINKSVDVIFNKCKVKKILFIFIQSKYIRSENLPVTHELNSKIFHDNISKKRRKNLTSSSELQDIVYKYFKSKTDQQLTRKNKRNYTQIYSRPYPQDDKQPENSYTNKISAFSDQEMNYAVEKIVDSNDFNIVSNIVQSVLDYAIEGRSKIFNNTTFKNQSYGSSTTAARLYPGDGIVPIKDGEVFSERYLSDQDPLVAGISLNTIINYLNSRENSNYYEYSFSIKNISFGVNTNLTQNKACFISKKIDTSGAPVALKALVNRIIERPDLNYKNYDLTEPGSYELSISYKEIISSEEDWIPIPAFSGSFVESETAFFNELKEARLRFIPNPATIRLYKNGMLENPSNWSYIEVGNKLQYSSTIDPSALYAVTYSLSNDISSQSVLDVDSLQDSNFTIKSYTKDGNNGEIFSGSGPGNKIKLSYNPYVENKFTSAVYSSDYGTINTTDNIGYSPVKIVLQDGTVAINLTNYLENSFEKPVFSNTNQYLFVQNGKEIIFNKSVNQPMIVNYSYIPSLLRFRLIIRNNLQNQFNGISINNVILKAKTKNLDTIASKLIRFR